MTSRGWWVEKVEGEETLGKLTLAGDFPSGEENRYERFLHIGRFTRAPDHSTLFVMHPRAR